MDQSHKKYLLSGVQYDGKVYHQDINGRMPNVHIIISTSWKLVPVAGNPGYYHIIDLLHGKALVAGNNYDGRVYHQAPQGRKNAEWKLVKTDTLDVFEIYDAKHGKALVAGDNYDGRVYHQAPNNRLNGRWKLLWVD
ncbi:MAG: hypothetical protein H6565_17215 [Lewinellaceae bacterium]|nr:hypothetical protein [Lewinellaceae bacterium]